MEFRDLGSKFEVSGHETMRPVKVLRAVWKTSDTILDLGLRLPVDGLGLA